MIDMELGPGPKTRNSEVVSDRSSPTEQPSLTSDRALPNLYIRRSRSLWSSNCRVSFLPSKIWSDLTVFSKIVALWSSVCQGGF